MYLRRAMGKGDGNMRKLGGFDALADLHRAMGGESADLVPDSNASELEAPDRPAILYVSRDRKARKGKEVTLVEGFDPDLHDEMARSVAKSLKALCGVGGGWKDGVVLLQGDHRQRVADWLTREGHSIKHKGG
ncbi:MAG: translation initiation factor [Flavobacteriales bacterium]